MTTQEKNKAIAEWLGFKTYKINRSNATLAVINRVGKGLFMKNKTSISARCDFFQDRNQQKLIEDKLMTLDYNFKYEYQKIYKTWIVLILGIEFIMKENKSKDIAFIDAVIELIKSK